MSIFQTTGDCKPFRKMRKNFYLYRCDVQAHIQQLNVKFQYAELSVIDFKMIVIEGWDSKTSPDVVAHRVLESIKRCYTNWQQENPPQ